MGLENRDLDVNGYVCRQHGSIAIDERRLRCCGEEMKSIDCTGVTDPELMRVLRCVFSKTAETYHRLRVSTR